MNGRCSSNIAYLSHPSIHMYDWDRTLLTVGYLGLKALCLTFRMPCRLFAKKNALKKKKNHYFRQTIDVELTPRI